MSKARFDRSQFIMMFFAFSLGMVLSNLLSQSKAGVPEPVVEILFTYKGIDKTKQDVSTELQGQLDKLASKRHALLEQAALEQYLYDYSALKALSLVEAGKQLFNLEAPSEDQVSDFFMLNADKIKKPFFEVKADIRRQLMIQNAKRAKKDALDYLVSRGDLVIFPKQSPKEVISADHEKQ